MKNLMKVAIAITAIATSTAFAEDGDVYGYFLGSYQDADDSLNVGDGLGVQLGIGREFGQRWNLEGYFQSTGTGDAPKLTTIGIGSDLQFVMRRGERFEPYLFAGVAMHSIRLSGYDTDQDLGLAAGIGFRTKIGNSRASLRGEFRHRDYDTNSIGIADQLYSIGIQFPFGSDPKPVMAAAPVAADTDGDGVNDDNDRCPNTPAGVSVDSNGCAVDNDGDGVADHMDECANTVRGAAVDAKGCELDGDNDGVVDRLDKCPDSAAGVQVDINGCEIKEEIQLSGVNFESNSDRLVLGATSVLNDAAATLNRNPEIKVEVAGHTDSDGEASYNESLSARRAETVRDYLISKNVDADRMTTRGYGESQPITDNTTSEGKAANRRVVLRVTER